MLDCQLSPADAVKVVVLAEQFHQAVAHDRAIRAVICRALRHPEVREIVRAIIREDETSVTEAIQRRIPKHPPSSG